MNKNIINKRIFKDLIFTFSTVFSILFLVLFIFYQVDLYYNNKYHKTGGLNKKGYRGELLGEKPTNEIRIAMLGGSTTYCWTVEDSETIPYQLERLLNKKLKEYKIEKKVKVINLGWSREGLYAIHYNLIDFKWLDYDYALIYADYNDIGIGNNFVYRHFNPIFRLTGYMPIIPLITQQKCEKLFFRSKSEIGKERRQIVFNNQETYFNKESFDRVFGEFNKKIREDPAKIRIPAYFRIDKKNLFKDDISWYKFFYKLNLQYIFDQGLKAIIVTQPDLGELHKRLQVVLRDDILKEFEKKYKDRYICVNLADALNLSDTTYCFDGEHLNAEGNIIIAEKLAVAIFDSFIKKFIPQVKADDKER